MGYGFSSLATLNVSFKSLNGLSLGPLFGEERPVELTNLRNARRELSFRELDFFADILTGIGIHEIPIGSLGHKFAHT